MQLTRAPDQQCHQNPPTSRLGYCAGRLAEVLLVATQPQNARTPECPHNAPLVTLLPTTQMPQRWFHILCTVCWNGFTEHGISAPNLVRIIASFQLETKIRLPDKLAGGRESSKILIWGKIGCWTNIKSIWLCQCSRKIWALAGGWRTISDPQSHPTSTRIPFPPLTSPVPTSILVFVVAAKKNFIISSSVACHFILKNFMTTAMWKNII